MPDGLDLHPYSEFKHVAWYCLSCCPAINIRLFPHFVKHQTDLHLSTCTMHMAHWYIAVTDNFPGQRCTCIFNACMVGSDTCIVNPKGDISKLGFRQEPYSYGSEFPPSFFLNADGFKHLESGYRAPYKNLLLWTKRQGYCLFSPRIQLIVWRSQNNTFILDDPTIE
jgi:hypothetical protein